MGWGGRGRRVAQAACKPPSSPPDERTPLPCCPAALPSPSQAYSISAHCRWLAEGHAPGTWCYSCRPACRCWPTGPRSPAPSPAPSRGRPRWRQRSSRPANPPVRAEAVEAAAAGRQCGRGRLSCQRRSPAAGCQQRRARGKSSQPVSQSSAQPPSQSSAHLAAQRPDVPKPAALRRLLRLARHRRVHRLGQHGAQAVGLVARAHGLRLDGLRTKE